MSAPRFDPGDLERYDSLFIAPHADDVPLACPARLLSESERGRRVLVLALFAPVGDVSPGAAVIRRLGAEYVAAGLVSPALDLRTQARFVTAEGEDMLATTARVLADVGPRTRAIQVYAPLGLGHIHHRLIYEATLRAFASEPGRSLFLYEERPEAFVPGAVRVRLALLGARLPPGAVGAAAGAGLVRHLLRVGAPARMRGEAGGLLERLERGRAAAREWRLSQPWNPSRALGPRLQPVIHTADADALDRAREAAEALLPRAAKRFAAQAAVAAKRLGGVYHAERFWLFLPSGDGLPEIRHPLDTSEDF